MDLLSGFESSDNNNRLYHKKASISKLRRYSSQIDVFLLTLVISLMPWPWKRYQAVKRQDFILFQLFRELTLFYVRHITQEFVVVIEDINNQTLQEQENQVLDIRCLFVERSSLTW